MRPGCAAIVIGLDSLHTLSYAYPYEEPRVTTLQIRDERAKALAREIAARRGITMTQAVIEALESELKREREQEPLAVRLKRIATRAAGQSRPGGRAMTKDEVDEMWSG
jgi:antitoxin VapB